MGGYVRLVKTRAIRRDSWRVALVGNGEVDKELVPCA